MAFVLALILRLPNAAVNSASFSSAAAALLFELTKIVS